MTTKTVHPLVQVAVIIAETVKEVGPDGAPEGPMYAALMGKISLGQFNSIVNVLVDQELVEKRGHVLYWKGGKPA